MEPIFDDALASGQADEEIREAMKKERASILVRAAHAKLAETPEELAAVYDDLGKLSERLWGDDVVGLYLKGGKMVGGFTVKILLDRQKKRQDDQPKK